MSDQFDEEGVFHTEETPDFGGDAAAEETDGGFEAAAAESADGFDAFPAAEPVSEPAAEPAAPAAVPSYDGLSGAGGGITADAEENKLIAFNREFRERAEQFDMEERSQVQAKRDAAKEELTTYFLERLRKLEAKKSDNRDEEKRTEEERLDSLHGESWARVNSLVNLQSDAERDTERMKDLLIDLKAKPLPAVATGDA
jgi:hypothetical protein